DSLRAVVQFDLHGGSLVYVTPHYESAPGLAKTYPAVVLTDKRTLDIFSTGIYTSAVYASRPAGSVAIKIVICIGKAYVDIVAVSIDGRWAIVVCTVKAPIDLSSNRRADQLNARRSFLLVNLAAGTYKVIAEAPTDDPQAQIRVVWSSDSSRV